MGGRRILLLALAFVGLLLFGCVQPAPEAAPSPSPSPSPGGDAGSPLKFAYKLLE